jgi:hypothetical protein
LLLADRLYNHGVGPEVQCIFFGSSGTEFTKDDKERCLASLPVPEKIEVSRRPVHPPGPESKEHRSLEQESIPVRRAAESVQESLHGVAGEKKLKVFSRLSAQVLKTLANRGCLIPWLTILHVRDSR